MYDLLQNIILMLESQPELFNDPVNNQASPGMAGDHEHSFRRQEDDQEMEEASGIATAAAAKLEEKRDLEYQARF